MIEEKIIVQANTKTANLQLATFAAGCFWGVEEVQSDPNEVSYEDLLSVFCSVHDPTTKNRQCPDIGF